MQEHKIQVISHHHHIIIAPFRVINKNDSSSRGKRERCAVGDDTTMLLMEEEKKKRKKLDTRCGARTHDHTIKSRALYRTELTGHMNNLDFMRFKRDDNLSQEFRHDLQSRNSVEVVTFQLKSDTQT